MEVTLRRFELSDVDAMMAWASDPAVAAFCRWEPYQSTEPLLAYLRDTVLPHPWFRAICLATGAGAGDGDGRPVGRGCRWRRRRTRAAGSSVDAVLGGEVSGLARVEALVDVDNRASQRVVEKAGFRREGVLRRHYWHKGRVRDLVMYSFVSSDQLAE
ncbi:hypothetical protein OsJ_12931 [Oryza sativa Japonica Group]|uniref:N-acetyltransferase domain-containing protein n=1 Tax=Oryza sativa subsp. japonica TaxID=39947 RepID=A3ANK2_ORYSJ|nr:hypothetical protein OsJ_12931 [Oryza sativa Japonica Group]